MLNHLEQKAHHLGFELVIEQRHGVWVIIENISDCYAYELPMVIGDSESEAESWLNANLSETAGM